VQAWTLLFTATDRGKPIVVGQPEVNGVFGPVRRSETEIQNRVRIAAETNCTLVIVTANRDRARRTKVTPLLPIFEITFERVSGLCQSCSTHDQTRGEPLYCHKPHEQFYDAAGV